METSIFYFIFKVFPGPFVVICLLVMVTSMLGDLVAWYMLVRKFPDRDENALFRFKGKSGEIGLFDIRGGLDISVCDSGLRIRTLGIVAIFGRHCFVPWDQVQVEKKSHFSRNGARIQYGSLRIWSLRLRSSTTEQLAQAAQGKWPVG